MAIYNLSKASNIMVKKLKNKYHIPVNAKSIYEILKIIETEETKIEKYLNGFSQKNKVFFEKYFHEITRMLQDCKGSYSIHSHFANKFKEVPSLGSFKKLISKIKEVQNGKSKR